MNGNANKMRTCEQPRRYRSPFIARPTPRELPVPSGCFVTAGTLGVTDTVQVLKSVRDTDGRWREKYVLHTAGKWGTAGVLGFASSW